MLLDARSEEDYTPMVPQAHVRVVVDSATVRQFVEQYYRFLKSDRIFIVTELLEALGSVVQFRIDLPDGTPVLRGCGTVIAARSPGRPGLPAGIVLRFVVLDEQSAEIVEAMSRRRALATPPGGIVVMEAPPAGSAELAAAVASTHKPRPDTTEPFRPLNKQSSGQGWRTHSFTRHVALPVNPLRHVSDESISRLADLSRIMSPPRRPPSRALRAVTIALVTAAVSLAPWNPSPERRPQTSAAHASGAPAASASDAWRRPAAPPPRRVSSAASGSSAANVSRAASASRAASVSSAASAASGDEPVAPRLPPAALVPAPVEPQELHLQCGQRARVWLDGRRVGSTPLTLRVAPGPHDVVLARARYETVQLQLMAPASAAVRLERPRATLRIDADVAGAQVFVNGAPAGAAPVQADVAAFERAAVELRAPGYRRWHKRIYVNTMQIELQAVLEPSSGHRERGAP